MEIDPGIYQFKLPIPDNPLVPDSDMGEAFAYLVRTDEGYILVDAGWNSPDSWDSLLSQMAETGVRTQDIRWIVITHYHPDHFGLAGKLQKQYGASLAMHHLDIPNGIRDYYLSMPNAAADWLREWRLSQGMSHAEAAAIPSPKHGIDIFLPEVNVDIPLEGGEVLDDGIASLEVIWTPGHTPGHICLYDKRRGILFAGDQVLPEITPHIAVHPHTQGDPLGDYLDSLGKLDNLEVKHVLPGHEYSFSDLHRRIAEIKEHHRLRSEETLQALKVGPQTSCQVASHLTWHTAEWSELSPQDRQMAMFEAMAHLRHLQQLGEVDSFKTNGLNLYEIA